MDDLHIGILGAGHIARRMAATVAAMPGVRLYAVASRDAARAQAFAAEFGAEKAYGSYEALAADDRVGLVYIATPHSHHAEQALLCLHAGRPVLCEKPFAPNAAQAARVLAAARERGVFIAEAMWTRFLPFMQTLRQVADSGEIGAPLLLSAACGGAMRHVPRLREPELAGGALLDVGVYPLTVAAIFFGAEPECISGEAVLLDTGVDASASFTLRYPGGRLARLACSMVCTLGDGWELCGEEGRLAVQGLYNPRRAAVIGSDGRVLRELEAPPQITGFEYEVEACRAALAEGRCECPEMPHAETLRLAGITDALRRLWGVRYPFDPPQ